MASRAILRKRRAGPLARFFADESGATAIEYALIAVFVSISIVAGATAVGGQLSSVFGKVSAGFSN